MSAAGVTTCSEAIPKSCVSGACPIGHVLHALNNNNCLSEHDIKHSAEKSEDISYSRQDFEGKIVEKDEVIKHLEYAIEKGYLKCEMENGSYSISTGK